MSQISPPIRIVLVCVVAFMAAWILFLKPGDPELVEPATAPAGNVATGEPAVTGPGEAAQAAQGAVAASNAQLEAQQSVDGVQAGEVTAGSASQPAAPAAAAADGAAGADLTGVPAPVAKAIRKDKVVVLLFWNRDSVDDRLVRSAVRGVDRWNGRVAVHEASIKKISRYGKVTRGADVEQSPTVVVVDRRLRAETLVGYVDTATIDQAVVDALRNSGGVYTSAYLRRISEVCTRYASALWTMPDPDNPRQLASYVSAGRAKWARFRADFAAVPAPGKWRGLKRATMRDNAAWAALYADWAAYLGANPGVSRIVSGVARFQPREAAIAKRYDARMDDAHVLGCGSNA